MFLSYVPRHFGSFKMMRAKRRVLVADQKICVGEGARMTSGAGCTLEERSDIADMMRLRRDTIFALVGYKK